MQIFRPGANTVATVLLASLGVIPVIAIGLAYQISGSPYVTNQNVTLDQPVPFSHEHHVGGLGLDCRNCHTSVEKARFAGLPPTEPDNDFGSDLGSGLGSRRCRQPWERCGGWCRRRRP